MSDEYRLLSSSLCSFLHSPVTSSLLGPNNLLNTLFSNPQPTFLPQCERPSFTSIQNNRQNMSLLAENILYHSSVLWAMRSPIKSKQVTNFSFQLPFVVLAQLFIWNGLIVVILKELLNKRELSFQTCIFIFQVNMLLKYTIVSTALNLLFSDTLNSKMVCKILLFVRVLCLFCYCLFTKSSSVDIWWFQSKRW
jgi:hypothetical protein